MPAKKKPKSKSAKKKASLNPVPKPRIDFADGDFRGTGVGQTVTFELSPEIQSEMALERRLGEEKYQKLCEERAEEREKLWKEREAREAPIKHLLDEMVGGLVWFRPDLATEVIQQTVPLLPQECLNIIRRAVQERQKSLDRERRRDGKPGKPSAQESPRILFQWLQVAWWKLVQGKTWKEIARAKTMPWKDAEEIKGSSYILKRQVNDLAGMVRAELFSCGAGGGERSLDNTLAGSNARAMLWWKFKFPLCPGEMSRQRNRGLAQALYFPGTDVPSDEQVASDAIDLARKLYAAGDGHEPHVKLARRLYRRRSSPGSKR